MKTKTKAKTNTNREREREEKEGDKKREKKGEGGRGEGRRRRSQTRASNPETLWSGSSGVQCTNVHVLEKKGGGGSVLSGLSRCGLRRTKGERRSRKAVQIGRAHV